MSGFFITDFAAMVPRADPRLLANGQAQNAVDCRLWSGALEAFQDTSLIVVPTKVGTKKTIYRFGQDIANEAQYWFHWTVDVDVVRGPINSDVSERTYWTGETEPRVTDNAIALTGGTDYPMNWYKLGIPKPAAAPAVAVSGAAGTGDPKTVAAVYTYVSAWGEEGPPSDPSGLLDIKEGQTLNVNGMSVGPGAGYNIVSKRIYVAISGSSATDYQFFAEVALATVNYAAVLSFAALSEVIPSKTWIPPLAGLKGLTGMANGMMAGFDANDIWLAEPYLPHAWPARYRKSVPYGVVGLGTFDTVLVAVTKGGVFAGSATTPAALTLPQKGLGQAGVSKRGIVSFPGGVVYPSSDGLAVVDAGGWRLATEGIFTPKQWQALKPESINAYRWGNRYVGFYDTGTGTQRGFIFDLHDQRAGFVHTEAFATAGYLDPQRGALYLQIGGDIRRWDSAGTRSYTWRSKIFTMPKPINPGYAQVMATSYPVTFKLYGDGVLRHTQAVASREPFSLPSGDKWMDFEVQIEGSATVRGAAVAETMKELRGLVS